MIWRVFYCCDDHTRSSRDPSQSDISPRWIKENISSWQESVVCSPDEGGTRRAGWVSSQASDVIVTSTLFYRILAEKLHLPMALIHKESFNEVSRPGLSV